MLSLREEQVLRYLARGASIKVIAYELGVSTSTISAYIKRAQTKMGARSRFDMFRARIAVSMLPPVLTDAERDVIHRVLDGKTHEEIASERHRSVRTVAKQASSALRKLGVRSRAELVVLFTKTEVTHRHAVSAQSQGPESFTES
jgi:DNA-binding NarL/FixJ family response regulator